MIPTLTVFTPTYNRAYCLHFGYEALLRQTSKDFMWLIIDDGSSDNTKELVDCWQKNENEFDIKYLYKENGGLHTGYNTAIEYMYTELAVCIDSDDFMPDNAVEVIIDHWRKYGSDQYAGIVGLDFDTKGNVIGSYLPEQKSINLIDLATKYRRTNGDRKNVVRTDIYKQVAPMKSFENEKNFNPHYMHLIISKQYDFLVINKNLCYVEYQSNGMTNNMIKQYLNSPKSFIELRKLYMTMPTASIGFIFKHAIHYVSSSIISRNRYFLIESPKKMLTVLAIPFGIFLTIYIYMKGK